MRLFERGKTFIAELKRRKVFHVGSLYLIAAWGGSLGAAELFPAFGIPDWAVRAFVLVAMLGFPLALILAWAFEITPDGVVRDPGKQGPAAAPERLSNHAETTTHWAGSTGVSVTHPTGATPARQFDHDFTIGRDASADYPVPENRISRRHARVYYRNHRWYIEDLGSRNGTLLNGHKLTGPAELQARNEVVLYEGGLGLQLLVNSADVETQLA